MSSPLETLFVVLYLGMTQSMWEFRPLAFTELQGSLGEKVYFAFSGSVVRRRLCFLLESTRGMCYRQRAGVGCWVAKQGKSGVHDSRPHALHIYMLSCVPWNVLDFCFMGPLCTLPLL